MPQATKVTGSYEKIQACFASHKTRFYAVSVSGRGENDRGRQGQRTNHNAFSRITSTGLTMRASRTKLNVPFAFIIKSITVWILDNIFGIKSFNLSLSVIYHFREPAMTLLDITNSRIN